MNDPKSLGTCDLTEVRQIPKQSVGVVDHRFFDQMEATCTTLILKTRQGLGSNDETFREKEGRLPFRSGQISPYKPRHAGFL